MTHASAAPYCTLSFTCTPEEAEGWGERLEVLGALSVAWAPANREELILEPPPGEMPLWSCVQVWSVWPDTAAAQAALNACGAALQTADWKLETLPEHDWATLTQDLQVLDFPAYRFAICPSHLAETAASEPYTRLWLDPGPGFGTGQHPTTYLCIEALLELHAAGSLAHTQVLDFGSGSGILGITALVLHADCVYAIDWDEQARTATWQNAVRNGCDSRIHVLSTVPESLGQTAHIVCANVLAEPLLHYRQTLLHTLRYAGWMILSGLLISQVEQVIQAYCNDWSAYRIVTLQGWAAIIAQKKEGAHST